MKVILNNIIPLKGFAALNFFGVVLFVRKNVILTERIMNHEKIHTAQMRELGYIMFYAFYGIEWLVKLFKYHLNSYYNISFEREAYQNEGNMEYLKNRKRFSFMRYF